MHEALSCVLYKLHARCNPSYSLFSLDLRSINHMSIGIPPTQWEAICGEIRTPECVAPLSYYDSHQEQGSKNLILAALWNSAVMMPADDVIPWFSALAYANAGAGEIRMNERLLGVCGRLRTSTTPKGTHCQYAVSNAWLSLVQLPNSNAEHLAKTRI